MTYWLIIVLKGTMLVMIIVVISSNIRFTCRWKILTCHQQLYTNLLWHLLCRVARDEVEHIRSAVRLSHIRNPKRAVFTSWLSQVLNPVHVGWILQDTGAVEDISETNRHTHTHTHTHTRTHTQTDLGSLSKLCCEHFAQMSHRSGCVFLCVLNNTLVWYSGCLRDTTSQTELCTAVLLLLLHPNREKINKKLTVDAQTTPNTLTANS